MIGIILYFYHIPFSNVRYVLTDFAAIFNNLFFNNFNMWNEERMTQYYVNNYEDALTLANSILVNLTTTKKYYTFERTSNYYTGLSMDTCTVYKLLTSFQDNPDKYTYNNISMLVITRFTRSVGYYDVTQIKNYFSITLHYLI